MGRRFSASGFGAALLLGAGLLGSLAQEAPKEGLLAETKAPSGEKPEFIGAQACLSCHQDKEGFKSNIHAKALPNAKGIELEKACETCHGPGSLHGAAAGDKNNPDFWTIRNPAKLSADKGSETCLECHAGEKQRMFWSGSVHEAKGVGCASCHSAHGESERLLKKGAQNDVCLACHGEVRSAMLKRSKHPLRDSSARDGQGRMTCSSCHNPHGSQSEKLIAARSVNDKCFECHAEKKAPLLWEHGPVKEDCLICHAPHGSSNGKLLVTRVPRLCQQCHMQGRHQSGTFAPNSVYAVGRACLNCHPMIHGTNHPSGAVLQR